MITFVLGPNFIATMGTSEVCEILGWNMLAAVAPPRKQRT